MENKKDLAHGYLITETITGELRSRLFHLEEDLDIVDGDGDLHSLPVGAKLVVVEVPYTEDTLGEKLLDTAERYFHGLWGHRPHAERSRTTFDIRTAKGGRRPDVEEPPF